MPHPNLTSGDFEHHQKTDLWQPKLKVIIARHVFFTQKPTFLLFI
jgi:hypothetical protein